MGKRCRLAGPPVLMLSLVLLAAAPASPADYWPLTPGLGWHYRDAAGLPMDVTIEDDDGLVRWSYSSGLYGTQRERMELIDGDVIIPVLSHWFVIGGQAHYFNYVYEPPLLFLDLPLEAGKSWASYPNDCIYLYLVEGPQSLTVPAGTFTVMHVREIAFGQPCSRSGGDYYLDRTIGPVVLPGGFELVSYDGIVETTPTTWGAVKGLYR